MDTKLTERRVSLKLDRSCVDSLSIVAGVNLIWHECFDGLIYST